MLVNDDTCGLLILEFLFLVCRILLILIVILRLLILIYLHALGMVLSRQEVRSWSRYHRHITGIAPFYMVLSLLLGDASVNCKRIISLVLWGLRTRGGKVYCCALLLIFLLALFDLIPQRAEVMSDLLQLCSVVPQTVVGRTGPVVTFHVRQSRLLEDGNFLFILV